MIDEKCVGEVVLYIGAERKPMNKCDWQSNHANGKSYGRFRGGEKFACYYYYYVIFSSQLRRVVFRKMCTIVGAKKRAMFEIFLPFSLKFVPLVSTG